MEQITPQSHDGPSDEAIASADESASNLDRILPLVSWIYETLEKATEIADSRMSRKEGLVLLILYKRRGFVPTGHEMEAIFRSWNDAHRSDRAIEDLGIALGRLLRAAAISADNVPASLPLPEKALDKESVLSLRNLALTNQGWFRVGAMRAVIQLRLESAQEKFSGLAGDFFDLVAKLELPPLAEDGG